MFIRQIIYSSIIFVLLDAVYLSTFSNFFNGVVKRVQGAGITFNIWSGVLCYASLLIGLNYFILNDKRRTALEAFLLGFIIYSVYETTNYAILKNWSPYAVIIDSVWGGILFMLSTVITRFLLGARTKE